MAVLAHLDSPERAYDRRSAKRRTLSLAVEGQSEHGPSEVIVHDLSEVGLLLETSAGLTIGDQVDVVLPHAGATRASIAWRSGRFLGCEFHHRITSAAVSAALLQSTPAPPSLHHTPVETPADAREDQLPPHVRFYIIVALALIAWALVAGIYLAVS